MKISTIKAVIFFLIKIYCYIEKEQDVYIIVNKNMNIYKQFVDELLPE